MTVCQESSDGRALTNIASSVFLEAEWLKRLPGIKIHLCLVFSAESARHGDAGVKGRAVRCARNRSHP